MLKKLKEKILSAQYYYNSVILNIFGIQVFRYIAAHWIYYNKFKRFGFDKDETLKKLKDKGHLRFENFIDENQLNNIKIEFEKLIKSQHAHNVDQGGGTKNIVVFLEDEILKGYKHLNSIRNDTRIKKIFCDSELKDNIEIKCRLERIHCISNDIEDKNKNFHYDTFHNTFKAWLYLTDSNLQNGPLNVIEGTNRFSFKKLFYIYTHSIYISLNKKFNKKKNIQLFRFFNKKKLTNKSKNLIANKKDFLLANTHSIHRRGDALENTIRDSIHFYTRENPFY